MKPTTELLAEALEATGDPLLTGMILRARGGFYHPFLSELPSPMLSLITELRSHGHHGLADEIVEGAFAPTDEEARVWLLTEPGKKHTAALRAALLKADEASVWKLMDDILGTDSASRHALRQEENPGPEIVRSHRCSPHCSTGQHA